VNLEAVAGPVAADHALGVPHDLDAEVPKFELIVGVGHGGDMLPPGRRRGGRQRRRCRA